MKRIVPLVILVVLLAIVGGIVLGSVQRKRRREAEMNEFYLCETRFQEEQYQDAAQRLDTFLQSHPKSEKAADSYYYLAMSQEKLGNRPQSMTAWRKIIESYPESPNLGEAYYSLAAGQQELGQYDEAMNNYKTVVDKFSNMPRAAGAWYGLGVIYEMKAQESEAAKAYQNVLQNHPSSEFAIDAERKLGNINLKRFLKDNALTYEIRRGDSLVRIARKFRVAPGLIKRLNDLSGSMLQPGAVLKVLKPDFNIAVDVSKFKLYLRSGDKVIKRYTIATGKPETPTPTGDYKVTEKLTDPVWYNTLASGAKEIVPGGDPRNELGSRWIGFKPAYGVHGTIYPDSIGKAMSKGCVRMHNQDVEELYDMVAEGTPVRILAGTN